MTEDRHWTVYRQGVRQVEPVPSDRIGDALSEPGTVVTLDLDDPRPGDLEQAQRELGLPALAVKDALHDPERPVRGRHRPKLRQYGDHAVLVLNTVSLGPHGRLEIGDLHLFLGRHYMIAARQGAPALTAAYDRAAASPDELARGPAYLLAMVLDEVVDCYFPVLDELEDRVDELEEEVFEPVSSRVYASHIRTVKHDLIDFQRVVAPLREVLTVAARQDFKLTADAREQFRDVYDHVIRIDEDLTAFRDLATSALDSRLAWVANQQNDVTKKLSAWAAILAVPAIIASIYGMNFREIPELEWKYGYYIALGVMLGVAGGLYGYFKRKGWL